MTAIKKNLQKPLQTFVACAFGFAAAPIAFAFDGEFAPTGSISSEAVPPFRQELILNGRWQFQPVPLPTDWKPGTAPAPTLAEPKPDAWDKVLIKIPSPWNVNSYGEADGGEFRTFPSYPTAWEKVDMAWLRREFQVPSEWKQQRIFLKIDAIAGDCEVRVNGKKVGGHFDNFLPLEIDVTDAVKRAGANELLVGVRAPKLFNVKGPVGELTYPTGSFFGMHIAGIWQDVKLLSTPAVRTTDVFVHPLLDKNQLRFEIELQNDSAQASKATINWQIKPWVADASLTGRTFPTARGSYSDAVALKSSTPTEVEIPAGGTKKINLEQVIGNELKTWTPETPNLYGAVIEITQNGQVIDRQVVRFGWRQFKFVGTDMHLNGKPYRLKGEITHFMGVPYMSPRHAWAYYRMLKDAHVNTVRLHAMPHPKFYLDLADEMGMVIVGETGLWGSNCNFNYDAPELWTLSENQIDGMLRRDRNHPGIVGWSVMNECLIAIKLRTSDPAYFKTMSDKFVALLARVRALDPTRPYVVCEDPHHLEGNAASIIHYVGPEADRAAEAAGRPWAITEDSQAWFSLPPFASQWAGDRAYENFAGRLEGVGIEVYELLTQRHVPSSAFYISPYSVTWYGLKHLPLGHPNTERPQTLTDGVLFTAAYQEGKAGMQPERIAPYSMTLNPGYDPAFPLYQPTPFFESLQAAFAPDGPLPCAWDQRRAPVKKWDAIAPLPKHKQVHFLGDVAAPLAQSLVASGVPLLPVSSATTATEGLLLVDASSLPTGNMDVAQKRVQNHKGTVLLWAADPAAAIPLKQLAPAEVRLTEFTTTALLPNKKARLAYGFSPAGLYFSEASTGRIIQRHGLEGPLVEGGTVVLFGNKTDWPSWRAQTESTRNQILYRSENEARPSSAALVEFKSGSTQWLVTSLEPSAPTPEHREMFRTLFRQLAVELTVSKPLASPILGADGAILEVLTLGPFTAETYADLQAKDFIGGEAEAKAEPGTKAGGQEWKKITAGADGVFALNPLTTDADAKNSAAYLSFWVFSPRSDDVLEGNPLGAKIDLSGASDDGLKIWYNGKLVLDSPDPRAISYPPFQLTQLSLKRGWNHFLIKALNVNGLWQFRANLRCNDASLASGLKVAVTP